MISGKVVLMLFSLLAVGEMANQTQVLSQEKIDMLDKKWIEIDTFLKANGIEKGLSVLGSKNFGWIEWDRVMTGLEQTLLNQTGVTLENILEFKSNLTTESRFLSENAVKIGSVALVQYVKILDQLLEQNKLPTLEDLGASKVVEEKISQKLRDLEEQILEATGLKMNPNVGLRRSFLERSKKLMQRSKETNLLEDLKVMSMFFSNQTSPSLQTLGISTRKQKKFSNNLKEIERLVFEQTGFRIDDLNKIKELVLNLSSTDELGLSDDLKAISDKLKSPSMVLGHNFPTANVFGFLQEMNKVTVMNKKWIKVDTLLKANGIEKGLQALDTENLSWEDWDKLLTGLESNFLSQARPTLEKILDILKKPVHAAGTTVINAMEMLKNNSTTESRLLSENAVKIGSVALVQYVKILDQLLEQNKLPTLEDLGASKVVEEKISQKLKELEEMILVEGLKGLSRPTRGLPRGFFENGILEEISVLNKFIANQTNPSLQTMGISIEKQLKLTESLKEINKIVFEETGLTSQAIEQIKNLGENLNAHKKALSKSIIDRLTLIDEMMIRHNMPSIKQIPEIKEFNEERLNIFLTSLEQKLKEKEIFNLENVFNKLKSSTQNLEIIDEKEGNDMQKVETISEPTTVETTTMVSTTVKVPTKREILLRNADKRVVTKKHIHETKMQKKRVEEKDIKDSEELTEQITNLETSTEPATNVEPINVETTTDGTTTILSTTVTTITVEPTIDETKSVETTTETTSTVKTTTDETTTVVTSTVTTTTEESTTAETTTVVTTTTESTTTVETTTVEPTTVESTTVEITSVETTTVEPTTVETTTESTTTVESTTVETTSVETTTIETITVETITVESTIAETTTNESTTTGTTTVEPATIEPTATKTTTIEPETIEPTTVEITTVEPTTIETTTESTTTVETTAVEITTVEPTTVEPTTVESTTVETTTVETTTVEPTTESTTTVETTTVEITTVESSTVETTTVETTTVETTTVETTTVETSIVEPITVETTTTTTDMNLTVETTTLESLSHDATLLGSTTLKTTTLDINTHETTTVESIILETTTLESTTLETNTFESTTSETTILVENSTTSPLNTTENFFKENLEDSTFFFNLDTSNSTNTSNIDLSNQIQFEIKNYTILSDNSSLPNTYSLRIRIKGYKWNNEYLNTSSLESRLLLQEKILPLLYKNLNLAPEEIKEVKLLKLFKGKRSSSTSLQEPKNLQDRANNEDNDIVFDFQIKKAQRLVVSEPVSNFFHLRYSATIVATSGPVNFNLLNNTLEQIFKQAILKHFDSRLANILVTTSARNTTGHLPMRFTIDLTTHLHELIAEDVTRSISEFAVNSEKCQLVNSTVTCSSSASNEFNSLYRVSDLWLSLDQGLPKQKKSMSIKELFAFNSAWVFGLIIIACILALFFVGCILAICYTRKPYRKPSKVYDMESAVYNKMNNHKPSMYPTTKKQIVPRHKEVYY